MCQERAGANGHLWSPQYSVAWMVTAEDARDELTAPALALANARPSAEMRYVNRPSAEGCGLWTDKEHERFLQAMKLYPTGPWRAVAAYVGTRNVRQTMTHAQKHKQKIARHQRGLLTRRRQPREETKGSSDDSDASPVDHAPLSIRIPTPRIEDDDEFDPLPLSDTSSFMSMLQGGLVTPLSFVRHVLQDDEPFVLETPVVADCLDYLVRSFA